MRPSPGLACLILTLAAGCGRVHIGGDSADVNTGQPQGELPTAIQHIIQTAAKPDYVTRDADGTRLWQFTRSFYEHRQFAPAWIKGRSPRPQMDAFDFLFEFFDTDETARDYSHDSWPLRGRELQTQITSGTQSSLRLDCGQHANHQ